MTFYEIIKVFIEQTRGLLKKRGQIPMGRARNRPKLFLQTTSYIFILSHSLSCARVPLSFFPFGLLPFFFLSRRRRRRSSVFPSLAPAKSGNSFGRLLGRWYLLGSIHTVAMVTGRRPPGGLSLSLACPPYIPVLLRDLERDGDRGGTRASANELRLLFIDSLFFSPIVRNYSF